MNRVEHVIKHFQTTEMKPPIALNCAKVAAKQNASYRYTLDGYADRVFTKQQRDFYEENGYIVIRNLLPIEDVNICNQHFDDVVSHPEKRVNEMIVMRDIALAKKIQKDEHKLTQHKTTKPEVTKLQMFANDPIFFKHYLSHPRIVPYLKAFVGKDCRSYHHMYINKPTDPGTLSSRHPLHQDLWYFPVSNLDRMVACWTALQPVNRTNGGLCVIPGSHKAPDTAKILVHDYPKWHGPVNMLYVGIPHDAYMKVAAKRIHLDMQPGDCVFFHGLVIHGSSANLTNRFRRSLCCHFINSKLCGFKPFVRKDRVQYGKYITKRMGQSGLTYKTYWKLKSRQIMGDSGDWALTDEEFEFGEKTFYKRKSNRKDFTRNPTFNEHLMRK